jgi:oxygen-independent coproporphyrinogen-3 oxidase
MGTDAGPASERGVYVHVPFCRRRCPYCDFAIEVRAVDAGYARAVVAELRGRAHELDAGRSAGGTATLSFGGGTPSALAVDDLAEIVDGARTAVALSPGAEVSLELNPEDVDAAYANALRAAGFTRASLGVQSFDDDVLAWLGRAHDGARARAAVAACVAAGLRTGVDLIVGVPDERAGRLARDVAALEAMGVGHVSAYLLTVEPATPLVQLIAKNARAALDEDQQADAYEQAQELLVQSGWSQYEVSSYARAGEESRHNRLYWQGGEYLGVGPSAHSMRRDVAGAVHRRHTTARLDGWLRDPLRAAHDVEVLAGADAFRESVAFGLRDLAAGVDVNVLALRHNAPARVALSVHAVLESDSALVAVRGERCYLTSRGARFADRIARAVLAAGKERG